MKNLRHYPDIHKQQAIVKATSPYNQGRIDLIKKQKTAHIKRGNPHMLSHSFAMNLLEKGADLRYIHELLGHGSSKMPEIYTYVSKKPLAKKISEAYGKSLNEVNELSSDPDHGGKITLSSLLESMVAFDLEQNGILGLSVMRGPAHTDLEDGWGRKWDVKTPPYIE